MQRNEFETMVKELLPDVTEQAMEKWTQYAQELEQDGTEKESDLYDAAYVELQLIKEHQGEPTAASLFNYGEHFVFNYFELRGAAAKLTEGWTLEQIRDYTIENGCDPTDEEYRESAQALQAFRSQQEHTFSGEMCLQYASFCGDSLLLIVNSFVPALTVCLLCKSKRKGRSPMADKKNLCAMIPADLHARVRLEQEQSGKTLSEFVEQLITDYYKMKEGTKMTGDMRTMAIQLPEELFERLKAYLKRNNLKQKQFIIGLIEDALEQEEEDTAEQPETEESDEPDMDAEEE